MTRYTGLEFDRYVATYYVNKLRSCKDRNIEFNLSLLQVRNMLRAKRCQLTGIELTHNTSGQALQKNSDVTIDRIDCNRPYETGNVCAVSHLANTLKAAFESPGNGRDVSLIHTMSKNLKKMGF
jgi:hypothetical protein